ncbi:MAG: selenide, water dikinase SelD [Planctomycetota bacterium]|jgi:selenide,water dikinase
MKDLAKRRRVMGRSMRLDHCICDPKKPCPCDLLREKDVCLCAGERLEAPAGPVRLTQLVQSAGCASKIDLASLTSVLAGLPAPDDPRVLVGMPAGDDAGVFQLDGDVALVQTVDVFSPSVDDPYLFGQVAAANSVSDIYAMGGRPLTALSVVGFPIGSLPESVMREMLRGGIDKMAEAGVAVIGGHSIRDEQIKAGFAVTGTIDSDHIMTNAGALPGDALVLTKPLGTGILAFAAQIDRAPQAALEATARSMSALNKAASELMLEMGAHACTDVTGFGLAGHLAQMAVASGVDVEVVWDDLPIFPGVLDCLAAGIASGAVERNRESSGQSIVRADGIEPAMLDLLFDAQTSGGLLIALQEEAAGDLLARLREAGITEAATIGKVRRQGKGLVHFVTRGTRRLPAAQRAMPAAALPQANEEEHMESEARDDACCPAPQEEEVCCAEGHGAPGAAVVDAAGAEQIQQAFGQYMQAVNRPGALDAYTKQVLSVALSVLAKCEPCVKLHVRKAREMGLSQQEIEEAAWMAIAFGGSPTKMFYNSLKSALKED